ncbi:hypothetical protein J6590_099789 [Homalodisca vitripennis]|nr:hypothetical protein J6590_099789 [Homalodisca vitripennis]
MGDEVRHKDQLSVYDEAASDAVSARCGVTSEENVQYHEFRYCLGIDTPTFTDFLCRLSQEE